MKRVHTPTKMNLKMLGRYRFVFFMLLWIVSTFLCFEYESDILYFLGGGGTKIKVCIFSCLTLLFYYASRFDYKYHLIREKFFGQIDNGY